MKMKFPKDNRNVGVMVTIDGETRNLASWGRKIGLTRERVRQLHRDGKLEERVKAHLTKRVIKAILP